MSELLDSSAITREYATADPVYQVKTAVRSKAAWWGKLSLTFRNSLSLKNSLTTGHVGAMAIVAGEVRASIQ